MFVDAEQPWPLNAWYHAAWFNEVEDKPFSRTLLNEAVVLFRDTDGVAHALEDRCCHRATPLRLGDVVEGGLQCGYHGMVFAGDGKCVHIPGQDAINERARVRSFPVVERQEIIWIWMGDPALADESTIPDYPWNDDHENWPHTYGLYEINCNYNLLIDNLMDLTHIPFIHRNTIGGGDQSGQVNATMDVTPTETGVHYIRWMENIVPPPTYKLGAGWGDDVMCDRWQEFEFVAPATVIQWTGALEVGRGARESREDKAGGFNLRLYHGATPETEDSVHYFWSPANGYKPDDREATDILHEQIAVTFKEDLEFLEAQHAALVANPNDLVNIKHDSARMPARRAVDKMIQAETGEVLAAE